VPVMEKQKNMPLPALKEIGSLVLYI